MMLAARYLRSQGGYTLIEVVIASAIGAVLMTALTSVILTSWRATIVATSRIEASSEVRNFEYYAYDDFTRSSLPSAGSCTQADPCTTQPLTLTGDRVSNSVPVPTSFTVTYQWDGSQILDRTAGSSGTSERMATDVTSFQWYVDSDSTVVVTMTVTIQSYSETETFRFYPRVKS
ncbi:MAG TPA: prepilin-type N-terminal cleavage/methylation domain-containing protein [Candidatus Dormibacteraeota bacterium]|nr:prepilin-type N-terminal cleavage/methylation domain-containing protein [Candidatus Dormibacteraeota bacterium]